jgi:outer membrane protein TolC
MHMKKLMPVVAIVLIAKVLLGIPDKLYAQNTDQVVLDDLIQEALQHNPELQSAKEAWQATKQRIPQASSLPDPMVGYDVMGRMLETRLGPQEEAYEFEQMVPFPGKLIQKRRMARAEAEAAQAQAQRVEREVIYKVAEAYYDLYVVESTLYFTESILDILKKFEGIAEARYASQQGEQREVAKAQTEVSDVLQRIFMLHQQRDTLRAMLQALLNRQQPLVEPLAVPSVTDLKLSLEELLELSKQNRPELLEAKAMKDRASHVQTLAKYENAPDFSIGFEYVQIGEGETDMLDDGRDAWMIPLKVTVPLWQNRIQPAIREARLNFHASEAILKNVENMTDFEIRNAYYQYTTQRKIFDLYENAFIPQAELAFRSDQAGYEAGLVDILNLIDSERVYLNAKVAYYQVMADVLKSYATLERVVGRDLNKEEKP